MRVYVRGTIRAFAKTHPETGPSLAHWLRLAEAARWTNTSEVMGDFSRAKVLNGERIRFEVAGGNYRMIVAFNFAKQAAFIKFIGTHSEYDRIDALTVSLF